MGGKIALVIERDCEPALWGEEQTFRLKKFVAEAMQALQVPGAAISIVQGERVVFAEGFGTRNIDLLEPVTPTTRFLIGSATKPLTTLMMAKLVDAGAFAWTTAIRALLPEFALADGEITDRMELRHAMGACSGMARRDLDFVFRFQDVSPEQRLARMKTMRPVRNCGETFQYSNLMFAVGGYAASRCYQRGSPLASGYEAAMQDLVFTPLGMTGTCLTQREALRGNSALPHALDLQGRLALVDPTLELSAESIAPAGGAWSSAEDMSKYLFLELLGGKTAEGASILSEEAVQSRWRDGIKIDAQTNYGLGLMQSHEYGCEVLSHGGNTFGFSSNVFFIPKWNLGVAVLTNVRSANTFLGLVRQRIFEFLCGREPKAQEMVEAASTFKRRAAEIRRERVQCDPAATAWLEEWTGDYWSEELGPARISREGERFRVQFESWGSALGAETEARCERAVVLTSPPWSGTLRLQMAAAGQAFLIHSSETAYRFERVAGD